MYWKGFSDALGTRNSFNAGSVDDNNKFVAQSFLYGNSMVMPIPDLLNADFLLLIGTNPAETNLRPREMQQRDGEDRDNPTRGRVVVVDHRANRPLKALENLPGADVTHLFI